jgi:hypothetical protein
MLLKQLDYLGAAGFAIVSLGAMATIILRSRAASAESKVASRVAAFLFASKMSTLAFVQGE